MKIGIITLPFNWNYGGILQNYALQWVLRKQGHEPITLYRNDKIMPTRDKILSYGKRFILKHIFQKDVVVRIWSTKKESSIIRKNTDRFISENINLTRLIKSEKELENLDKYKFDAFITGSDQVWRPKYSPKLENHFLGFIKQNSNAKRISYAASFGTDQWEYSPKESRVCSKLAQQFDAISVREDSGINMCKKYLQTEPTLTLDPTMLVPKEEYIKLVEQDKIPKMPGSLFNYVLDSSPEKKEFIYETADKLGLIPYSSTAKKSFRDVGKTQLDECIFPSITQWLRAFMDAEFVITDSFHGTVFSIIFNKPFIALGNTKRGLSRFKSLLALFDLEDRLITENEKEIDKKLKKEIDFKKVNSLLEIKKEESLFFLKQALKTE